MIGLGQGRYRRRSDGQMWTKNTAIAAIAKELDSLNPIISKNTMAFRPYSGMVIDFMSTNYSTKDMLELNGSVILKFKNHDLTWIDLFSQCKSAYGDKYDGLKLHRDEEWEGSKIQKECREVLVPFFRTLLNPEVRYEYLANEEIVFNGKVVPPPYREPLPEDVINELRTLDQNR